MIIKKFVEELVSSYLKELKIWWRIENSSSNDEDLANSSSYDEEFVILHQKKWWDAVIP